MTNDDLHTEEMSTDTIEVLISALEHYSYCPRQCALIHLEQTYEENYYTMRGSLAHERVDSGDDRPNRGVPTQRALPLWSEQYGIRGKADVVEWHNGVPYPVEYKSGRRKDAHPDVQLCAQALCLEEMLATAVPCGAIYYIATRKRHEVTFDTALRDHTLRLVAEIRAMLQTHHMPAAPNDRRCRHCSLFDACMPDVVGEQTPPNRVQRLLFTPHDANEQGDD